MTFQDELLAAFGADRVKRDASLATLTTFRVGGAADWLLDVRDSDELTTAIRTAARHAVPITVLGGGSNVLVADSGIRGLVLRQRGGGVARVGPDRIRADAGVTINGLVRWTITHAVGGLEAWAGTPGTVGGAIFGNAHFDGRLIGDHIVSVRVITAAGVISDLPRAEMEFEYDVSRLQWTGEIAVWAEFAVSTGEPAALRDIARQSLAYRKRTQPLDTPSAGCIFRNPDPLIDRLPPNVPPSAGALIDRAGLKGHAIGDARVSPTHANFIVNDGRATAEDIRQLVRLCQRAVKERFGIDLREEIVYLGEFKS
jgi:UDP-N-acetylmuramate dehydrogenase